MGRVRDRTEDFKDAVRHSARSLGYDEVSSLVLFFYSECQWNLLLTNNDLSFYVNCMCSILKMVHYHWLLLVDCFVVLRCCSFGM